MGELTDAGILRAEHRQGAAWYEFRHDYLVGQVASWVNGVEQRRVRRLRNLSWITLLVFASVTFALLVVKPIVDFNTYVVSFRPHRAYAAQQEELWITRKFDPFADHVTTSLYQADLRDHVADNRMREGFVLPLGQPLAWESFADLFRDGKPATFQQNAGLTPDAVKSWLLEESIGLAVAYAEQEPATVTALLAALKDNDQEVRSRAAAALGQLGHADADVVAALVQAVKDRELYLRSFVKEKMIESGIADRGFPEILMGSFALVVAALSPSQFSANETAALVRLGRDDPAPVATTLVAALRESDSPFLRVSAAKILGQISRAPPSTVPALVEALKDRRNLSAMSRRRHWGTWRGKIEWW